MPKENPPRGFPTKTRRGEKTSRDGKTALRRLEIVAAAVDCFLRKGFHQTSMRDISSGAGVSLGNLYNHFENKEALVFAIAEAEAAELTEASLLLAATGNAIEVVAGFAAQYLQAAAADGGAALMVEIAAEAGRNPRVAARFLDNRRALAAALAACLARGIEAGEVDATLDTAEAAELVIDLVEGVATRSILTAARPGRAAVQALDALLRKSLAPPPQTTH